MGPLTYQNTLHAITEWADIWQLPISTEKSKWISLSNRIKQNEAIFAEDAFKLANVNLPNVSEVLDLGINFNSKLNFTNHISAIISKAKQRLFRLKKMCMSKNPAILILGFKTYILPILEHCSQVWNPHTDADVRRIESVQRLFTKKLPGFQGLNYIARMERANLQTLELRRLWADLCFCYKIVHGLIDTPIDKFFILDRTGQTRGHSFKIKLITPRLDTRLHFFSFRVANPWNSLSPHTVDADSFLSFKARLRLECLDNFVCVK